MDIEEIMEMIIMREVEVGLGIGNISIIIEGMIEATVGLDQVQEPVLLEIGLDALNAGGMIILVKSI